MKRNSLWVNILFIVVVWALTAYTLHQTGIIDFWYWRPD